MNLECTASKKSNQHMLLDNPTPPPAKYRHWNISCSLAQWHAPPFPFFSCYPPSSSTATPASHPLGKFGSAATPSMSNRHDEHPSTPSAALITRILLLLFEKRRCCSGVVFCCFVIISIVDCDVGACPRPDEHPFNERSDFGI